MSRHSLAAIGLFVVLAAPLLIQGCSDDNPTEPLPPTTAVIELPTSGAVMMADEPVQMQGHGVMSTGQPVYPNRLVWYLGAIPDTTFLATGFSPTAMIESGDHTITLIAHESVSFKGISTVNFTVEDPENWDPVATIIEPLDGEDYLPAHVVTVFRGLATDVEDGDLTGSAVVWTSDLQGTLGEGPDLESALLPGVHQIVLTVTDTGGQTDADTLSVEARSRPSAPIVGGPSFFRASEFTELCPDKAILQLIGAASIDIDGADATMTIGELAGSLTCDIADVCDLSGEWTQGNIRVTATGINHVDGGTVTLEFSLFMAEPNSLHGLVRGIESPASGPECVYRSFVVFSARTE